ncbi:MAG: hypothetical protein AB8C84_05945 [Oligoflexales bacterium]
MLAKVFQNLCTAFFLVGCTYSNAPKIQVSVDNLREKKQIQRVLVLRNPFLPEHITHEQLVDHADRTWPERNVKNSLQIEILSEIHMSQFAQIMPLEWYRELKNNPSEWEDSQQEQYQSIHTPDPLLLKRQHKTQGNAQIQDPRILVQGVKNEHEILYHLNSSFEEKNSEKIFQIFDQEKKFFANIARLNTWMFQKLDVDYLVLIDINGDEKDYNAGKKVLFRVTVIDSTTGWIRASLTLPIRQGTLEMPFPSRLALVSTRAFDELRDFEDLIELPEITSAEP